MGTIPSGTNPFVNGVFTVNEVQVNAVNGLPWFTSTNTVVKSFTDVGLNLNVFEPTLGTPTLIPPAGSLLLTTVPDFTGTTGLVTSGVNYIGAFGAVDWTTGGWVNWNPQLSDYSH